MARSRKRLDVRKTLAKSEGLFMNSNTDIQSSLGKVLITGIVSSEDAVSI
jgi:hypothetical protein